MEEAQRRQPQRLFVHVRYDRIDPGARKHVRREFRQCGLEDFRLGVRSQAFPGMDAFFDIPALA